MKVISWFSGIGGFDLAFLRAGHEIVGACEIEPFCRRVYVERFGTPKWFPEDIRKVKADEIPEADLWCAGSPCQGFSIAGKRGGLADDRSGLLRTWIRLVGRVRPRWVLLENVPGILTIHGGADFAELTSVLDELGYVGAWATLDARYFGVPQRRRRVFVVGRLGDGPGPGSVLAEPEGGVGDSAASLAARESLAYCLAASARGTGDGHGNAWNSTYVEFAASLRAADGHHGRSSPRGDGADTLVVGDGRDTVAPVTSKWAKGTGGPAGDEQQNLVCGPLLSAPDGSGWRSGAEEAAGGQLVVNALEASAGGPDDNDAAGKRLVVIQDASGLEHKKQNGMGVMEADEAYTIDASRKQAIFAKGRHAHSDEDYEVWEEADVAPTLTETETRLGTLAFNIVPESGQGSDLQASETDVAMALSTEEAKKYERGTRIVAGGVRRLTPLECERLQGLPDGWTCLCGAEPYSTASCKCPDGPRYRALGNAVARPVVEWIARRLP